MIWVLVAVGGGIGAVARHALNGAVHRWAVGAVFPHGIFLINVLGSAIIGLIAGLLASSRIHMGLEVRTFVIVGILGGFTTFSSFSLDTLALIRDGHGLLAAWNVAGQVGLSLLAVGIGFRVGSFL